MLIIRTAASVAILVGTLQAIDHAAMAQTTATDQAVVTTTAKPVVHRTVRFSPSRSRAYARTLINERQFKCLDNIWTRESHWNHMADNPNSTAFGIPQMLGMKTQNPYRQIHIGLRYIWHRYGSPCAAWDFWQAHSTY